MGRNGRSRRSSDRRRSGGAGKKSNAPTLGAESIPRLEPGIQCSKLPLRVTRAAPSTRTSPPERTLQEEIKEEMEWLAW